MGSLFGGSDAGDSAIEASEIAADSQREALDYLKETERIPEYLRQAAMAKLGGVYGINMDPAMMTYSYDGAQAQAQTQPAQTPVQQQSIFNNRYRDEAPFWQKSSTTTSPVNFPSPSGQSGQQAGSMTGTYETGSQQAGSMTGTYETGSQQDLINQAISSPLYGAIMGGQQAGEEAILRSSGSTGGLRSGNVQSNLYDYNTQLQNQALLQSYQEQLSGLQGFAGMDSNANQISSTMAGIGTTQAQGITAAAQAEAAASQQGIGTLMGLGNLGIAAYGAGMFSDRRLKKNIKLIGNVKGWPWYEWDWNIVAQKMGMKGKSKGIMADEVFTRRPDCVIIKDFFMFVLYGKLGVFDNGRS